MNKLKSSNSFQSHQGAKATRQTAAPKPGEIEYRESQLIGNINPEVEQNPITGANPSRNTNCIDRVLEAQCALARELKSPCGPNLLYILPLGVPLDSYCEEQRKNSLILLAGGGESHNSEICPHVPVLNKVHPQGKLLPEPNSLEFIYA